MSGSAVFLDANGLVALHNADDDFHELATRVLEQAGRERRRLLTTNLVLAEYANSFARSPAKNLVAAFIRDLLHEPRAHVVHPDGGLFERGLRRYNDYADKHWGLVDCVSFELMVAEQVQDAFTNDHHFEQAGFTCLLRRS